MQKLERQKGLIKRKYWCTTRGKNIIFHLGGARKFALNYDILSSARKFLREYYGILRELCQRLVSELIKICFH
jgi:hypothetical protein